jgi:ubiquinone/menaquinone biosynthesis C-methylase UbiE
MTNQREQYTMGYGPAATMIMAQRTAETHAAFFIPHLKPGMSLLDCGCGPGTITLGFAELLAPGEVVGTEIEESHVALARENAARRGVTNVCFETADLYQLPFADDSFDAVFISAVLSNLREPLRALREAFRVMKPGGVVGLKEFDHGGDMFFPEEPAVKQYQELYLRLRREFGHDPECGRKIGGLLLDAGFDDLKLTAFYESFTEAGATEFAQSSIGMLSEKWRDEFLHRNWATAEEIDQMIDGWSKFSTTRGAVFAAAWCEAVAHKALR